MFLKSLVISTPSETIRTINFHRGINLIVDESENQITGNNVGKTTVLRLIDFCLGADKKIIYADPENSKKEYTTVKDFLIEQEIIIILTLVQTLDGNNAKSIVIKRNFLPKKQLLTEINGEKIPLMEFEKRLSQAIFPFLSVEKPTFRQIISHNIRHTDSSLTNTLKTLNNFTKDVEYETLNLYLLGCKFDDGNARQKIVAKLKIEKDYKSRLEKNYSKNAYETTLNLTNANIENLLEKKQNLRINENLEHDLDSVNNIKHEINKIGTEISILSLRRDTIIETKNDFEAQKAEMDISQLHEIYKQAASLISNLRKRFEDLVDYHNKMISEKVKFITEELPQLEYTINEKKLVLARLVKQENDLSSKILQSDTFEELEEINTKLNDLFKKKGELETIIVQIEEVDTDISDLSKELAEIDEGLFSDDFKAKVKRQVDRFNLIFSKVSNYLYGEQYAITYEIKEGKNGQQIYKFDSFNTNLSSGKKQGEISCFDIAYTMFADEIGLPCLHFLLNDKKELVHDNQLVRIANYVNEQNIQFVASILRDKLPDDLNREEYFIVKLSQKDKLFKIENN